MSCQACQESQDDGSPSYFRWKNANIQMNGCNAHLNEVMNVLRSFQEMVKFVKEEDHV